MQHSVSEDTLLAHLSNIQHKQKIASGPDQRNLVDETLARHSELVAQCSWDGQDADWLTKAVEALELYTSFTKDLERRHSFFGHRGNFAGSVLPEFLARIVRERFRDRETPILYSTRKSVVDITMSGFKEGGWIVRDKDQDLCIGLRRDMVRERGKDLWFVVPVVATEVKTNLDVNKLNGLDFSAERLKRTFPGARYFVVTETLDYRLDQNYSGSIDEIFVLRMQKRSAARRDKARYRPEVFEAFLNDVAHRLLKADTSGQHVYERLESGRLINV